MTADRDRAVQTCPERSDGTHCEHWWDGNSPCCGCGDDTDSQMLAELDATRQENGRLTVKLARKKAALRDCQDAKWAIERQRDAAREQVRTLTEALRDAATLLDEHREHWADLAPTYEEQALITLGHVRAALAAAEDATVAETGGDGERS